MKKLVVMFVFTLSGICSVNAQWYEKSCGVQDIESATSDDFECLWNRADKTIQEGMRTCGVGTGIAVLGGITMAVSSTSDGGYSIIGAAGVICGLSIVVVSIPIWVVGASRRSKLMESPAYQDFQPATLQITPLIDKNHFNKQASLGLTASLNF